MGISLKVRVIVRTFSLLRRCLQLTLVTVTIQVLLHTDNNTDTFHTVYAFYTRNIVRINTINTVNTFDAVDTVIGNASVFAVEVFCYRSIFLCRKTN